MSILHITVGADDARFRVEDHEATVPVGIGTLCGLITADPPAPEELTNAIGWLQDHLEDVTREVPAAEFAERVELSGPSLTTLADVEVGGPATMPFELSRDAAEDVFRTLVTERAAARLHNPGLPAGEVHTVLGAICSVVALMRFLHLDTIWLVPGGGAA
jgi:exopolyphosphatase / guanosine-5'-triphosphate,3'-diphosphate pyrophosphatase